MVLSGASVANEEEKTGEEDVEVLLEGGGLYLFWYWRYPPTRRSMVLVLFGGVEYSMALQEMKEGDCEYIKCDFN